MKHFDYETIREKVVDAFGRRVVLSLFKEFQRTDYEPLWSLRKDWYPIYMSVPDPTEYETAMCLLGNWEHYQLVRNHPKIKPIMDKWAKEMEVKMRSDAIRSMIRHSGAPNGAAAAKWVAEGQFMKRLMSTKADRIAEEEVREELAEKVSADMERLGLKVVNGGKE
jgi:hypothetical protein